MRKVRLARFEGTISLGVTGIVVAVDRGNAMWGAIEGG